MLQEPVPELTIIQARASNRLRATTRLAQPLEFAVEQVQLCMPVGAVLVAAIPKAFAASAVCQADRCATSVGDKRWQLQLVGVSTEGGRDEGKWQRG